MFKTIVLISLALLSASCSLMKPKPVAPNEKAFAAEDAYILIALRAEEVKNYAAASDLFEKLYEGSDKKEYLYRSLDNDIAAKNPQKVLQRVDAQIKDNGWDAELVRLKVMALVDANKLDEAITLSVSLASKTKKPDDYLLTSEIYVKRQEFDIAVKYLESAYAREHNEKLLDKLSIVLYVNLNKKKEAIAYLETHLRMFGCSKRVCARLIAFYSDENNIDGLLSTYLRVYKLEKSEDVAKKIIQIYKYKQDYFKLMEFLEESGSDDEALLQLYSSSKNYAKAYPLANKLYEKTLDPDYLGQSAIYEYENAKDKNAKELLSSVVTKLKKAIDKNREPMYLNYLGYILIDHSIDVKEGMKYINEVLALQPNSAYYLDSLAWGYYKFGECQKAKKIMNRVVKLEGGDDPEVKAHIQKINKCLKR